VRRRSKRCVDFVFGRIAQLLHLVETAATDNANRRNVFIHARRDLIPNGHVEKPIMCPWRMWRHYVLFPSFMPKFFIKTYGCQMNERDSEQVAHSLIAHGYERVGHESEADVVLLNTCSVRDMADQKALGKMGMMGRMAKERPHVVFGFLGCMAQARGASLLKDLPHVDLVVGTQKFHRVADYVEQLIATKAARTECAPYHSNRAMDDLRFSIVDIEEEAGSQSTIHEQQLTPKQATAFVSIMQGCNMHCTFCIVPRTRGAERSRTIAEIVSEVRALVAHGVKEVTLLGQIVNLYGRHEFPAVAAVA